MGIEDFIRRAHCKPNDYHAYHVGRELAELYPEKAIVAGEASAFDLEAFVRAEKCSVVSETSATDGRVSMDEIICEQLKQLRSQMAGEKAAADNKDKKASNSWWPLRKKVRRVWS